VLRNLISPTRTRARIYDQRTPADPRQRQPLFARSGPAVRPAAGGDAVRFLLDWWNSHHKPTAAALRPARLPGAARAVTARSIPKCGALTGVRGAVVRVDENGELIVSVAVPVQRFRAVGGRAAALHPARRHRPDRPCRALGHPALRAGVAAMVTIILSLLLAGTIAGPLRRLAGGAACVRGVKSREEIPDFSDRTGRDRAPVLGAALDDLGALQPHRGDRALRRRRGARAQEPADLAAQRGRDPAARQAARGSRSG
jgi:two-component system sensor histidine kinase ChvG